MKISGFVMGLILAAAGAKAAPPSPVELCLGAFSNADGMICRQAGERGVVMVSASAETQVAEVSLAAREAERRFRTYFNADLPLYAIAIDVSADARSALRSAGFPIVLPWLSSERKARMQEARIRRAVEEQVAERGLNPAQVEALVQRALAQASRHNAGVPATSREGAILAHEIGHMLFFRSYWPDGWGEGGNRDGHYGGPAPDWLDETAAILHEDETLTSDRRRQFAMVYQDRTVGTSLERLSRAKLLDLPTFLDQEHPVNRRAREAAALARARGEISSSGGVLQLSGAEAAAISQDSIIFYLQARSFADFMLDRSGDPRIFHAIADAIAKGSDFEAWLLDNAGRHGLATDLGGLHRQWLAWLEETVTGDGG